MSCEMRDCMIHNVLLQGLIPSGVDERIHKYRSRGCGYRKVQSTPTTLLAVQGHQAELCERGVVSGRAESHHDSVGLIVTRRGRSSSFSKYLGGAAKNGYSRDIAWPPALASDIRASAS